MVLTMREQWQVRKRMLDKRDRIRKHVGTAFAVLILVLLLILTLQ